MSSANRAQRRRGDRERAKQARKAGAPPKVMPLPESGVEIDAVEDGVIVTVYGINTTFSVKWGGLDAVKIGEMMIEAGKGSKVVVETQSGLVVTREMP